MTEQYHHKWSSREGEISDGQDFSKNFLRWCNELQNFTGDDWRKVYKRISDDIKKAAQHGKDSWPPSSLEVVAYTESIIAAAMYMPFDQSAAVEDITAKEKRFETGSKECKNILSLFD